MDALTLASGATIELKVGDITEERADAIVNAANMHLMPGGGVCGAIHDAAGLGLAQECLELLERRGSLVTGEAIITGGHDLPAAHVIHTLGPVWAGGGDGEADQLALAYRSAIRVAEEAGLTSVAFPSISTGIFGFPVERAAPVALDAVIEALDFCDHVRRVTFVLYGESDYAVYAHALKSRSESSA